MRTRRRPKTDSQEHDGPDERWMASYLDMVTVLMCMFIVLFAMSTVDQGKFEKLKESLAHGFGITKTVYADVAEGVVVPKEKVGDEGQLSAVEENRAPMGDIVAARAELVRLEELRDAIQSNLDKHHHAQSVRMMIDERGLTIRLVGANTFFDTNSAVLTSKANRIMRDISGPLAQVDYPLSIEGNADHRAARPPYATNWELSAARAVGVLRDLVEVGHLSAERVKATAFGAERPISSGDDAKALAMDRRVDIVVLSDQPDSVRSLLPELLAEEGGSATSVTEH